MRIFRSAFEQLGQSQRNKSAQNCCDQNEDDQNEKSNIKQSSSLTRQFFILLSTMEQKFMNNPSNDLINQLIGMYQQCVELYDTLQDPIKYYFVEKIQNALTEIQTRKQKAPERKKIPFQIQKSLTLESSNNSQDEFHDVVEQKQQAEAKEQSEQPIYPLIVEHKVPSVNQDNDQQKQISPENQEEFIRQNQRARSKKMSLIKQFQEGEEKSQNEMQFLISDYQNQTSRQIASKFIKIVLTKSLKRAWINRRTTSKIAFEGEVKVVFKNNQGIARVRNSHYQTHHGNHVKNMRNSCDMNMRFLLIFTELTVSIELTTTIFFFLQQVSKVKLLGPTWTQKNRYHPVLNVINAPNISST